ncbi:MAG: hypothetical protein K6B65_06635 [Bacilli bacterium]|nr:hypothetical protein [Bacilli bacterium]
MFTNSCTLLFILLLGGSALILLLLSLIMALTHKKGSLKAMKPFTLLFAVITCALSVMTPLVYFDIIDINLKHGYFVSETSSLKLHVHSHSVSIYDGSDSDSITVDWTLKNDVFRFNYDSKEYAYTVKDLGTKLYDGDTLVFKYMKDQKR